MTKRALGKAEGDRDSGYQAPECAADKAPPSRTHPVTTVVEFQVGRECFVAGRWEGLRRKLDARRVYWTASIHDGGEDYFFMDVRLEILPEHTAWARIELESLVKARLIHLPGLPKR